jgi:hypothetical protein
MRIKTGRRWPLDDGPSMMAPRSSPLPGGCRAAFFPPKIGSIWRDLLVREICRSSNFILHNFVIISSIKIKNFAFNPTSQPLSPCTSQPRFSASSSSASRWPPSPPLTVLPLIPVLWSRQRISWLMRLRGRPTPRRMPAGLVPPLASRETDKLL